MFTTKMVGFTSKNDLQGWVAVGIEDDLKMSLTITIPIAKAWQNLSEI